MIPVSEMVSLMNIRNISIELQTNSEIINKEFLEYSSKLNSLKKKIKTHNSALQKFNKAFSQLIDEMSEKEGTEIHTTNKKILKAKKQKPNIVAKKVRLSKHSMIEPSRHSIRHSESMENHEIIPTNNVSGITKRKVKATRKKPSKVDKNVKNSKSLLENGEVVRMVQQNTLLTTTESPDILTINSSKIRTHNYENISMDLCESIDPKIYKVHSSIRDRKDCIVTPTKNEHGPQHAEITSSCHRQTRLRSKNHLTK